jgi:hypothetical protein
MPLQHNRALLVASVAVVTGVNFGSVRLHMASHKLQRHAGHTEWAETLSARRAYPSRSIPIACRDDQQASASFRFNR